MAEKTWLNGFIKKALYVGLGVSMATLCVLAFKGYTGLTQEEADDCYVRKDVLELKLDRLNENIDEMSEDFKEMRGEFKEMRDKQ